MAHTLFDKLFFLSLFIFLVIVVFWLVNNYFGFFVSCPVDSPLPCRNPFYNPYNPYGDCVVPSVYQWVCEMEYFPAGFYAGVERPWWVVNSDLLVFVPLVLWVFFRRERIKKIINGVYYG